MGPMGCGRKFQGPFALRQHLSSDKHSVPWPETAGMAGLPPEDWGNTARSLTVTSERDRGRGLRGTWTKQR